MSKLSKKKQEKRIKKTQGNKSRITNEFRDVCKEVKTFINNTGNVYAPKETKNQKMPIYMLKGIRAKKVRKFKEQETQNAKEGVLYSSMQEKINVDFWEKKKTEKKFKNIIGNEQLSYKFKGALDKGPVKHDPKQKTPGNMNFNQKSGMMFIDKKMIDSINKR